MRLRRESLIATSCAARRESPWPNGTKSMRAEIEKLVDEIKQSVGLLRRHL
jgi:hypothetical protein